LREEGGHFLERECGVADNLSEMMLTLFHGSLPDSTEVRSWQVKMPPNPLRGVDRRMMRPEIIRGAVGTDKISAAIAVYVATQATTCRKSPKSGKKSVS